MASDHVPSMSREEGLFTNPWPWLFMGLASTGLALLWLTLSSKDAPVLVIVGLIATGIGIAIRPQSPAVLGTATLAGLIGLVGMEWDSAKLMIGFLTSVAGLPRARQKRMSRLPYKKDEAKGMRSAWALLGRMATF